MALRSPSTRCRQELAELLGISLAELDHVLDPEAPLALDGHQVPASLNTYESLVQAAGRVEQVETVAIPGLLQTKAYSDRIERCGPIKLSEEEVLARVNLRLARQSVLGWEADSLCLEVLLSELVLLDVVGGAGVMAEQLDFLDEMMGQPTVDLRLLPADGRWVSARGGFELLTRPGDVKPFMAYAFDVVRGSAYMDEPDVLAKFGYVYRHLSGVALSATDTIRRIRDIRERYSR